MWVSLCNRIVLLIAFGEICIKVSKVLDEYLNDFVHLNTIKINILEFLFFVYNFAFIYLFFLNNISRLKQFYKLYNFRKI